MDKALKSFRNYPILLLFCKSVKNCNVDFYIRPKNSASVIGFPINTLFDLRFRNI